jgi:hypothetical protein
MMLALLALMSTAGAADPEAIMPGALPAVFADACLDGAVRLTPQQASEIQLKDAPRTLLRRFGNPTSGHIWRLNSAGSSFLYILQYPPAKGTAPKACGVAATDMNLGSATEMLQRRLHGVIPSDLHRPTTSIDMINARDGYIGSAIRDDEFTVLEIKYLTRKQQRRMLGEIHATNSQVPKSPRTTPEQK